MMGISSESANVYVFMEYVNEKKHYCNTVYPLLSNFLHSVERTGSLMKP